MVHIQDYDKRIIQSLIKHPRISDNALSKQTGIPLSTVNRRRKELEQQNVISYLATVNHYVHEPQKKGASELFIVTFKKGIARKFFLETFDNAPKDYSFFAKHIRTMSLGEKNGQIVLMLTLESRKQDDLLEIMNAELYPFMQKLFGQDAIDDVQSFPLSHHLRLLHNYMPHINMDKGCMKQNWPNKDIFVW
ncbi:MAG: winged helix-turn-helix domain-containing protein [Candidatus Woesearchaeota archaeon]